MNWWGNLKALLQIACYTIEQHFNLFVVYTSILTQFKKFISVAKTD